MLFKQCSKKVVLPKSVVQIQDCAFSNCHELREVTFEKGSVLKMIEQAAFSRCSNLRSVDLPEGLEHIEAGAF